VEEEEHENSEDYRQKELYNVYSSPNIVMAIKSKTITWVGRLSRVGNMVNSYDR
jgi:hypothetical protein